MLVVVLALAIPARAQRPLTLAEVLEAAVANNGALVTSVAALDQATGSLLGRQGQFDPLYRLELGAFRLRDKGFLQGFPFEATSRTWNLSNGVSGTTGTGTSYSVDLGVGRNTSSFVTSLVGGGVDQVQDAFTADASFSVSQQLLQGIRFKYNVQNVTLARQTLGAASLSVDKQRQEALFAAAQAYWSWVYQTKLHEIALEAQAAAEEALRVGQLQVERGQLAPVEATRLQAALVQAQQNVIDSDNLAQQAANTVLVTIGSSPTEEVLPATAAGDVPDLELDAGRAVEVALAQNLDVLIARQRLDTADIDVANAKHGLLPSLEAGLSAGVGSQRCPPGTTQADCTIGGAFSALGALAQSDNQPFVGVSGVFTTPIGNRSARGLVDQAGGVSAQRSRELADVERGVTALVEEQVRALSSARQRMELADANERLAIQTLEAEEALATAGRTIQRNVLEARTEVSRTQAEAAKARTDFRLAQAQLLKLQGQLTASIGVAGQ